MLDLSKRGSRASIRFPCNRSLPHWTFSRGRVRRSVVHSSTRRLVDSIKGSRHKNLKELRPGSVGATELRILFIFDPERRAILLVAGDKRGQWSLWCRRNIPIADNRYDSHLRKL